MSKTVLFSLCSLAIVVAVICWIAGVLPGARAAQPDRAARSGKSDAAPTPPSATDDNLSVYFSPNGGCTEAIVREVGKASQVIFVQAATFTSAPIAKALVAAHERGIDVRVVVDRRKDNDEKSQTERLVEGGVPTFIDGQHHTAHNKVILIDHRLLFTGSFNFTRESESENAENLLLIEAKPKLIAAYEGNFKQHLAHSTPYPK